MVKIVPQGGVANMGVTDPMSELTKTIDTFTKIQSLIGNQQLLSERADTSALNSLNTLNNLITNADDKGDLSYARNVIDSIDVNSINNPNTELIYNILDRELDAKSQTFDNIFNQGNELANLMTSKFSVFDTDTKGPISEKTLLNMNRNELVNYFNSVHGKDGAYTGITKINQKINKFRIEASAQFGMTDKGGFKKRPNFQFTDANGTVIDPTEYMMMLDDYQNRINMVIRAGFDDGMLLPQEAKYIESGDITGYLNEKQRKNETFKYLADKSFSLLNNIENKLFKLRDSEDEEYAQILAEIFSDSNAQDTYMNDQDKRYTNKEINIIPTISSDPEQMANNIVSHAMTVNDKEYTLQWYQDYQQANLDSHRIYAEEAQNWGIGWFGERTTPPSAGDLGLTGDSIIEPSGDKKTIVPKEEITATYDEVEKNFSALFGRPPTGEEVKSAIETGELFKKELIPENKDATNISEEVDEESEWFGSDVSDFIWEHKFKIGAGAAALGQSKNVTNVISGATNHLKDVYKLSDDAIISLFNDSDFKELSAQLGKIDDDIANFKKTHNITSASDFTEMDRKTPKGKSLWNRYKALLKKKQDLINKSKHVANIKSKIKVGDLDELKNVDLNKLLRNSGKWNLVHLKSKTGSVIRQSYRSVKDLKNILAKGKLELGPLDVAIHAFFLGQELDLGWQESAGLAAVSGYTTKKVINRIKETGVMNALKNPELQSKIGKFLIKKAPGTFAKLGIKGLVAGVGAVGSVPTGGLSSAISWGMAGWMAKDIYDLIKVYPEIKQYFVEYLESLPEEE